MGIWEAKENLKKGFRWVLGNGEEIQNFKDPWLKGKLDFRVEDNHLNSVRDERACYYFRPNSKTWDVHKVQHDFHVNDVQLILQTRIPQHNVKDMIAWTGSNQGQYTVKSGYQFWASQFHNEQSRSVSKGWSTIWQLQVPHKVRTFIWRFCRNNVPVRILLRSKGVATTISCPMCDVDIEHMRHLFCECPYVLDIAMQDVELAPEWLLDLISKENTETAEKVSIVLWGIWFARNKKVWEGRTLSPEIAMEISKKLVVEWQEANKRKAMLNRVSSGSVGSSTIQWTPPTAGSFKINVDASVYSNDTAFALGMILRDDQGNFIAGKNMKIGEKESVMEAEARGVQEVLNWVEELGKQQVMIESDSELVVHALQGKTIYLLEVGHILEDCREKLDRRADITICHVKKQANKAAHLLARIPCLLDSFNYFSSPPNVLLEMLSSDFSS